MESVKIKWKAGRPYNRRILSREDLEAMFTTDDIPELPDQVDWNAAADHVAEVHPEVAEVLIATIPGEFEEYVEPEPVEVDEAVEDESPEEPQNEQPEGKPKPKGKPRKSDPETGNE